MSHYRRMKLPPKHEYASAYLNYAVSLILNTVMTLWLNQQNSGIRTRAPCGPGAAPRAGHTDGGEGGEPPGAQCGAPPIPPPTTSHPPGPRQNPKSPPVPPGSHLHDGSGPHGQRREVASAVDGDGLAQDLVQPLHLLPCQHAEAFPGALLRAARSLHRQHRPAGSSPRKRCGKQPEIPGWG